jgi:hypothetical protein
MASDLDMPCNGCGQTVDATTRHLTVVRQYERHDPPGHVVEVGYSTVADGLPPVVRPGGHRPGGHPVTGPRAALALACAALAAALAGAWAATSVADDQRRPGGTR